MVQLLLVLGLNFQLLLGGRVGLVLEQQLVLLENYIGGIHLLVKVYGQP